MLVIRVYHKGFGWSDVIDSGRARESETGMIALCNQLARDNPHNQYNIVLVESKTIYEMRKGMVTKP